MDIVIITTVAQIVQRLLAHMREDAHATRHCIVNDALVHSMPKVKVTDNQEAAGARGGRTSLNWAIYWHAALC